MVKAYKHFLIRKILPTKALLYGSVYILQTTHQHHFIDRSINKIGEPVHTTPRALFTCIAKFFEPPIADEMVDDCGDAPSMRTVFVIISGSVTRKVPLNKM